MNEASHIRTLEERIADLEARLARRPHNRLRVLALATVAIALAIAGVGYAQAACVGTGSLCVFGAGTPALATEVNHNFDLVKAWLEQKVGPVGSSAITLENDADITGADQIVGYNDLRLSGDATIGNGSYDLLIGANGQVTMAEKLNLAKTLAIGGTAFGSYTTKNWNTDTTADTNGFVVAMLHADTDGDRCDMTISVDGTVVAVEAAHYYLNTDNHVRFASVSVPVNRGASWRASVADTSGTCAKNLRWVAFAP